MIGFTVAFGLMCVVSVIVVACIAGQVYAATAAVEASVIAWGALSAAAAVGGGVGVGVAVHKINRAEKA